MNIGSEVQGVCALREVVQVNVPESQGTGRQWHDDSRKERWADLSDCTTDAGSHSDLDKDAVEQDLLGTGQHLRLTPISHESGRGTKATAICFSVCASCQ